jgi:hypothetical protein
MLQTRKSKAVMNEAFDVAFKMNQDVAVDKAVSNAESLRGIGERSHRSNGLYAFDHEGAVELVAKLGIFLNGDTKQVSELLNKIK